MQASATEAAGASSIQLEPHNSRSVQDDVCSRQTDVHSDTHYVNSKQAEACPSQQPASMHPAEPVINTNSRKAFTDGVHQEAGASPSEPLTDTRLSLASTSSPQADAQPAEMTAVEISKVSTDLKLTHYRLFAWVAQLSRC